MDNGKTKFGSTKFKIYDDKLLIVRNRKFVKFSNMKEIFHEKENEAIIILKSDEAIPIRAKKYQNREVIIFKAFLSILNNLIEENSSNDVIESSNNKEGSEDKFDKLIKLGEMHEKGLLSDEEFNSLKKEILSENQKYSSVESEVSVELKDNVCKNCGATNSEGSFFCSECGTKLNV